MAKYVANYIKNDKLGLIANAHLAQADATDILSIVCEEIAEVHAKLLTSPKQVTLQIYMSTSGPSSIQILWRRRIKALTHLSKFLAACTDSVVG